MIEKKNSKLKSICHCYVVLQQIFQVDHNDAQWETCNKKMKRKKKQNEIIQRIKRINL